MSMVGVAFRVAVDCERHIDIEREDTCYLLSTFEIVGNVQMEFLSEGVFCCAAVDDIDTGVDVGFGFGVDTDTAAFRYS